MRRFLGAILLLAPVAASAHLIVDVSMSIVAPGFVTPGQSFTYHIIAEDVGYDPAYGVVATISVGTANIGTISVTGWNCSRSGTTITCSAEQIHPGDNPIDVPVTAPGQTGTLQTSVKVKTLGSYDPNPSNDTAAVTTVVYDPSQCKASPPRLDAPADGASMSGAARLSWSAVPGTAQYVVYATAEGAATIAVAKTASTSAVVNADPGVTEWWVEATFSTCPPVDSDHRHFLAAQVLPFTSAVYAGQTAIVGTTNGTRTTASFRSPYGLAFSFDQTQLFVTDEGDSVLRVITDSGVTTLAGVPAAPGSVDGSLAQFREPRGVAMTALDGYVYVADTNNDEIRYAIVGTSVSPVFAVAGAPQMPGYVDDETGKSLVNAPSGVAGSDRGLVYAADTGNHVIRKLTPVPIAGVAGLFTSSTAGGVGGQAGFNDGAAATSLFRAPEGVATNSDGSVVYVGDTGNHVIRKIANGIVTTIAGEAGVAGSNNGRGAGAHFNVPAALTLDDRGNLFVCDRGNHAIRRVAPSGLVTTVATGFQNPTGVAVDHSGRIFVADADAHVVYVVTQSAPTSPPRRRAVGH